MLFLSLYLLRRSARLRQAINLFSVSVGMMLMAEFLLLATPVVRADNAAVDPVVLLEGRYSDESLLVPRQVLTLDSSPFGEP
jgi:hypothetical protein